MRVLPRHLAAHTFYHLAEPLAGRCCRGLACFAARADAPVRWSAAERDRSSLYCLGKCYAGPSAADHDPRPHIEVHSRQAVLLGNVLTGGVHRLADYVTRGGGTARQRAMAMAPEELRRAVEMSGLRGRGGAGFPAGKKWQAVAAQPADRKYLVVNADEGDPGAFSDRFLLEDDPFRVLEAMIIAAHGVGAGQGYIYLRKEYPLAGARLADAIEQARRAGWLGERFDVELVIGAGSYLCGEETALLNALEGRRPEVRLRPPQISEYGLFGAPTLLHNVETLCALPWIVEHGAVAYAALGFSSSRGTKLLSLNSLFSRPGLYEVEFGLPLFEVVDKLGGGLRRGRLKGVMVGGPLAGIVPPRLLDTPLGYEEMQAIGCAVGHGGVIAFADDTPLAAILAEVFRFGASESCGKCTPCQRGTPQLAAMFEAAMEGGRIEPGRCADLLDALGAASLCGHGRGLAEFARAVQTHFPEEWKACFS
ncbi:complex I 51 kDa subunit family protein [Pseudogulbenkiania subflava]|uniref:Formate dehydrogenase iron-sulfur subunit n=1 Tax=Pseudogulbenkiania subflava DSM 22618 TaxID=1123014 RepID=A0A1Y6BS28_9NEIS|nr:NADH-ubiquinone oxidoreductase-F iron-sulfur binding region domain-containing protein [Pseudogulbenkiania subflava]SMF25175.1 formate dehydrogenase iron-sulfur subunit [Pseudogulbenkiania subflava DSM 22618]